MPEYRKAFVAAFPGPRDALTLDNRARAIEVFEATLATPKR
jgi:cytochrome c peroxidase